MENANPQISKKMFRTFFSIFLSLGIIFVIFYSYATYIGIKNNWGSESALLIVPMFLMLCFCVAFFITFLVLLIINKKRDNKKRFLIISIMAIILEIFALAFVFNIFQEDKGEMTYKKLTEQECALAKNATSYKDCSNMTTYCIQTCANTVNEKTSDLQGCINLSIDYAKKGTKCLHGGYAKDNPDCLKGFTCLKKNDYKIDGTNKDSLWVGYADGTYKCEVDQNHYCPPTEQ